MRFSFALAYVVVGEPGPFFESSSELAISFAWRSGRPKLNRRDASLRLVLGDDVLAIDVFKSRVESLDRVP